LLLNHHLLDAWTPVPFLLAQGQTLELNRHLLIAPVWTFFVWGPFGKPCGFDSSRRGWASPPTPCGVGTVRLAPVPSPPDVDPPPRAVCVTTPGTTFASATPVALSPDFCLVPELHEDLDPSLSEVPLTSPAAPPPDPVPPVDCSGVDHSLPGVYLANPVVSTAAAESGQALPPCGGGVQPGLPPAPSAPNVDPPTQLLRAAPYVYPTTSPMDDTTGTALDSLPGVVACIRWQTTSGLSSM